jgi:hypothetical protein
MTKVDTMTFYALGCWRARHRVVWKGLHTWKAHAALEDEYPEKVHLGGVPKCESVMMGWIDFAAACPPEMDPLNKS